MTTFSLTGLALVLGDLGPTFVSTGTLKIVASDDYLSGFTVLTSDPLESDIALPVAAGALFSATIGGVLVTTSWSVGMTRVDRAGGDVNDTDLLNFYNPGGTRGFIFELGGPALPSIGSVSQLQNFVGTNTFLGQWTQAARNLPGLDPGTFTALSAVTENDAINLAGQTWTGGTIRSGLGNDTVTGTAANDVIDLGAGRDIGRGGIGADRILGQAGNDLLLGGAGGDALLGGAGNDTLDGGANADRLIGGLNADVFVFRAGYGRDTVAGFEDGVDKIDLSSFGLTQAQVLVAATEVGSTVEIALGGSVLVVLNTTEAILRGDFIL